MAGGTGTGFIRGFQFQGGMADIVFQQFFANGCFNGVGSVVGDDMHSGAVGLPIHAPDVDMVDIQHTGNLHNMFPYLGDRNALGDSLQEQVQSFFQVVKNIITW